MKEKKRAKKLDALGLQVPSPNPAVYPHPISAFFARMYAERSQQRFALIPAEQEVTQRP